MHFTPLTSIVLLGLAVITPLVSAHPPHKTSDCSNDSIKPEPKVEPEPIVEPTEPVDLADCYHVNSPECDKAYDDNLAAYLEAHPDYNPNAEPLPDSKRTSNTCKCTGHLLADDYKGQCQYGDGWGYVRFTSHLDPEKQYLRKLLGYLPLPIRPQKFKTNRLLAFTAWQQGYADICVPTSHDPNCPGYGPDSKAH
ncbi:hypothetical protein MMC29_004583 [Sticta canariensis]|nr:hypothetical protein [Sticta canariensis]